jgi:hypothetical protein
MIIDSKIALTAENETMFEKLYGVGLFGKRADGSARAALLFD